jgi:hypothetical protein
MLPHLRWRGFFGPSLSSNSTWLVVRGGTNVLDDCKIWATAADPWFEAQQRQSTPWTLSETERRGRATGQRIQGREAGRYRSVFLPDLADMEKPMTEDETKYSMTFSEIFIKCLSHKQSSRRNRSVHEEMPEPIQRGRLKLNFKPRIARRRLAAAISQLAASAFVKVDSYRALAPSTAIAKVHTPR